MFCGIRLNHIINKLHERAVRIAYNDYSSDLVELFSKDDIVEIHQRNLRILATEMYKISNDFGPRVYPLGSIVIALVRLSVRLNVRTSVRL